MEKTARQITEERRAKERVEGRPTTVDKTLFKREFKLLLICSLIIILLTFINMNNLI